MRDEEYVFYETSRECKRNGRGAFNKVRGGGRHVRTPSDNMSKKEIASMNGEVMGFSLTRPVAYTDFVRMSKRLQEYYIAEVQRKFPGISGALIAESMGVKPSTLNPYLYRHNVVVKFDKSTDRRSFFKTEHGERYLRWVDGVAPGPVAVEAVSEEVPAVEDVPVVEEVPVAVEVPECVPEKVENKVSMKSVDMNNIAALLSMLAGTGAKLTIEISL